MVNNKKYTIIPKLLIKKIRMSFTDIPKILMLKAATLST